MTLIAVGALVIMGILDSLRLRILMRIGMRIGDALAAQTCCAPWSATNSQNGAMTVRSGLRDIDTIRNFVASQSFATLIDMPFAIILLVALYFLHPVYLLIVLDRRCNFDRTCRDQQPPDGQDHGELHRPTACARA